jgi:hypothetical protein
MCFLALCGIALAQNAGAPSVTDTLVRHSDSTDTAATASPGAPAPKDTLALPLIPAAKTDAASQKPSADSTKAKKPGNLKLVKREYGGKKQVLLATGMMVFVVMIMTAAQQWNPR